MRISDWSSDVCSSDLHDHPGGAPVNAPAQQPRKRNIVAGDDPNLRQRHSMIPCPHCHAPSYIRTSEMVTPTSKDLFCLCMNPDCGFTWKAQMAIVYGLSPSAIDRKSVV